MRSRRAGRPRWIACALLLVASGRCAARAELLGPELLVNTYTTSHQDNPSVAADGAGNFVVVWNSTDQDGSNQGVFGQRFDATGNPIGPEFQVNSVTTFDQRFPAVAADDAGNFVVVWESWGQDGSGRGVFGQRYDSLGGLVGSEFQANEFTTSDQRFPAVAADGSGSFVVAWESYGQDGDYEGVFARRFGADGDPLDGEFLVNTYTTSYQQRPAVAVDGSGNFVVAWQSYTQDGEYEGVFAQRFDSSGAPTGGELQVSSYTTGPQMSAAVAADDAGNFVVVWESPQDGAGYGVFGQRFDVAGTPVGSEFRVNAYTTGHQLSAAVAAAPDGSFLAVWSSFDQDASNWGVFGQRYDPAGGLSGAEFQINVYTTSGQINAAAAGDNAGNFVVAWFSDSQDGDQGTVVARQALSALIFADDFETGYVCEWSTFDGSSDFCP